MRTTGQDGASPFSLESAIDASPDAYIIVDREWSILFLNRTAEQMFGLKRKKAVGTSLWDALPDAADHFYAPLSQALNKSQSGQHEAFFPLLGRQLMVRYQPTAGELSLCFQDRTPQVQREQYLSTKTRRIEAFLDGVSDGIVVTDAQGTIRRVNPSAEQMFGYTYKEVAGQSISLFFFDPPTEVTSILKRGCRRAIARRKDGSGFPMDVNISDTTVEGEHFFVVVVRNITNQVEAERELRDSRASLARAQEIANLGSWSWNIETGQLRWSDQIYRIFGLNPKEFAPTYQRFLDRIHPEDRPVVEEAVDRTLHTGKAYSVEHRLIRPDGQWRIVLEQGEATYEDGKPVRMDGVVQDVTERKRAQEKIEFLANFDPLTGLPNRSLMRYRLQQTLSRAQREKKLVGVMLLDLDRFKTINNTLGPSAGNAVLNAVAHRLESAVRDGDTVARLGGDEFAVILDGIDNVDAISLLAEKILKSLRAPMNAAGHEVFPSATIGITVCPHDGRDVEILMRNADAALSRAKEEALGTYEFFTADMTAVAVARMRLERDLRRAIRDHEFEIYYQPLVNGISGKAVGVEALLRWRHPKEGLIQPADFVPLLEDTGLIVPVGEWLLGAVCRQARRWQDAGICPLRIAVNLSALQFRQANLVEQVTHALEASGLEPQCLELEITESILVENMEKTIDALWSLHDKGVHISIDDFGTGYSSMSYLHRLPVHALKIDRSFVSKVIDDSDSATITKAIIALAQSLGLKVIAEGVETSEQLAFLRQNGCNETQGYLFAQPLPEKALLRWLGTASTASANPPR